MDNQICFHTTVTSKCLKYLLSEHLKKKKKSVVNPSLNHELGMFDTPFPYLEVPAVSNRQSHGSILPQHILWSRLLGGINQNIYCP